MDIDKIIESFDPTDDSSDRPINSYEASEPHVRLALTAHQHLEERVMEISDYFHGLDSNRSYTGYTYNGGETFTLNAIDYGGRYDLPDMTSFEDLPIEWLWRNDWRSLIDEHHRATKLAIEELDKQKRLAEEQAREKSDRDTFERLKAKFEGGK